MPFNGSGVFQRVRNWVADAAAGIKIRADYHDAEDDGFAAGLTNCITRDGQSIVTENIPFNSKRITGLADPINPQDAATKASVTTQVTSSALPLTGGSITGDLAVTGNTTVVKLTSTGEIISTTNSTYRQVYGNYGTFRHQNGTDAFIMITASGDQYGTYNALRPFSINLATGNVNMAHAVTAGSLAVSGAATVTGTLSVGGIPVYANVPARNVSSGYVTVVGDGQQCLWVTGVAYINSAVHPIGTVITFIAWGGDLTIALSGGNGMYWYGPSGGTSGNRVLKIYGLATAIQFATGYWVISGNGLT